LEVEEDESLRVILTPSSIRTQIFRVLRKAGGPLLVISAEEVPEYCTVKLINREEELGDDYAEAA
jgi:flagellar biosynthesis component FlhA